MIEVKIPRDIREYKEKLFFGLNLRQSITTALAILVCAPLYVLGQKYISTDILSWIIILIASPLILIGFFNFNQMPFEKFVIVWLKMQWNPQKRPFKDESIFKSIRDEVIKEELMNQQAALRTNGRNKDKRTKDK